jgi:hypothetical protein
VANLTQLRTMADLTKRLLSESIDDGTELELKDKSQSYVDKEDAKKKDEDGAADQGEQSQAGPRTSWSALFDLDKAPKARTTWSDHGFIEWDGAHILRYNPKLLVTFKIFTIRGTVFDYRHKWIFIQVFLLLGLVVLTAWCASLVACPNAIVGFVWLTRASACGIARLHTLRRFCCRRSLTLSLSPGTPCASPPTTTAST